MKLEELKALGEEFNAWKVAHVGVDQKRFTIPDEFRQRMLKACSSFTKTEVIKHVGVSYSSLDGGVRKIKKTSAKKMGFVEVKPSIADPESSLKTVSLKQAPSKSESVAIVVVSKGLGSADYVSQLVRGALP